jgi:hypothetical protein
VSNKKTVIDTVLLVCLGAVIGMILSVAAVEIGAAQADDAAPMLVDAAPAPPDAMIATAPSLPPLPMPGDNAEGFLLASYKWILAGGWLALVPFLMALVWVARNPKMWPLSKWSAFQKWLDSGPRAPAILTLAMAMGGMGLHVILATGGAPTLDALKTAFLAGGLAGGVYSLLKAIIWNK